MRYLLFLWIICPLLVKKKKSRKHSPLKKTIILNSHLTRLWIPETREENTFYFGKDSFLHASMKRWGLTTDVCQAHPAPKPAESWRRHRSNSQKTFQVRDGAERGAKPHLWGSRRSGRAIGSEPEELPDERIWSNVISPAFKKLLLWGIYLVKVKKKRWKSKYFNSSIVLFCDLLWQSL